MLRALGVATPPAYALIVSLFCYPNPRCLRCSTRGSRATRRSSASSPKASPPPRWTRGPAATCRSPANPSRAAALTVAAIPFVDQDAYDRLLWASDLNFVRGEDSFVRAQWAAQPFVWHIYPQADDAHRVKLDAFLARYRAGLDAATFGAIAGVLARVERKATAREPPRRGRRTGRRCPHRLRTPRAWADAACRASRTSRARWSSSPPNRL